MGQLRWMLVVLVAARSTAESPVSSSPIALTVAVLDDEGGVVPNVAIHVSRRDKGADTPLTSPESPMVRSDVQGRVRLEIPAWDARHMAESLSVVTVPDFCQGLAPDTLVVPIRSGEGPVDEADATFNSVREAPLTRLALGESCGVRYPSYRTTLRLFFDTVTTTLTGVWFLSHSQSIAPQEGRFSGLQIQDGVLLTLQPDPPACDGVFTVTARINARGELMEADLEGEGGCFVAPAPPFFFVRRDVGDWP